MTRPVDQLFRLDGRVAVITGGAGMLGRQHAEAIVEAGGVPVLVDVHEEHLADTVDGLRTRFGKDVSGYRLDITSRAQVATVVGEIIDNQGRIDILINNAA